MSEVLEIRTMEDVEKVLAHPVVSGELYDGDVQLQPCVSSAMEGSPRPVGHTHATEGEKTLAIECHDVDAFMDLFHALNQSAWSENIYPVDDPTTLSFSFVFHRYFGKERAPEHQQEAEKGQRDYVYYDNLLSVVVVIRMKYHALQVQGKTSDESKAEMRALFMELLIRNWANTVSNFGESLGVLVSMDIKLTTKGAPMPYVELHVGVREK